MTPNQLPPLPDGVTLEELLIPLRVALETCHDSDWSLRQFKTPISHALAALAQQAQEPVDEQAEFEASMREKHGWVARDFQSDSFGYFDGHTATAWLAWRARASLQTKGQP